MERRILKRPPERQQPRLRLELDLILPCHHRPKEDEEDGDDEKDEKPPARGVAIIDFFI